MAWKPMPIARTTGLSGQPKIPVSCFSSFAASTMAVSCATVASGSSSASSM